MELLEFEFPSLIFNLVSTRLKHGFMVQDVVYRDGAGQQFEPFDSLENGRGFYSLLKGATMSESKEAAQHIALPGNDSSRVVVETILSQVLQRQLGIIACGRENLIKLDRDFPTFEVIKDVFELLKIAHVPIEIIPWDGSFSGLVDLIVEHTNRAKQDNN